MRAAVTILAGLAAGVLVAVGLLAAFVFVGPDPVGLRPTPRPTVQPSLVAAPSPSVAASPSPAAPGSPAPPPAGSAAPPPSGSAAPSPSAASSDAVQTGFHVGQPAPVVEKILASAPVRL